jgi:uncharacterized protein (UPF0264 family)
MHVHALTQLTQLTHLLLSLQITTISMSDTAISSESGFDDWLAQNDITDLSETLKGHGIDSVALVRSLSAADIAAMNHLKAGQRKRLTAVTTAGQKAEVLEKKLRDRGWLF